MTRKILIAGTLSALALAGCTTTTPQTQVTRFHLTQQVARGQIAVEPILPADKASLEFQAYATIVGAELARLGFTEAPGLATSEQVAAVAVERGTRETLSQRSPVTVGLGGGGYSGGYGGGGGAGVGISFPIGRSRSGAVVSTRLVVQIKRRSDASVIWEGRAQTESRVGTADADPAATVRRLAVAMFKDFPGESGRTVIVK